MGLFNVNMPMLYNEGPRTFIRLQEEIMKYSDDHSLFAWKYDSPEFPPGGLLANHPKYFAGSANCQTFAERKGRAPFALTNRGIRMDLHLSRATNIPNDSDESDPEALNRKKKGVCYRLTLRGAAQPERISGHLPGAAAYRHSLMGEN